MSFEFKVRSRGVERVDKDHRKAIGMFAVGHPPSGTTGVPGQRIEKEKENE